MVLTRNQARAILFLAAVVVVLLLVGFSHSFEHCVQTIKHYPAYDDTDRKVSTFIRIFRHFRVVGQCEAVSIDRHNGFLTALAGLAVACFTYTLWRSTEKLWEAGDAQRKQADIDTVARTEETRKALSISARAAAAAKRSADLAEVHERAYLFIGVEMSVEENICRVKIGVSNDGRSLGILKIVHWEFSENEPLSEIVVYSGPTNNYNVGATTKPFELSFPANTPNRALNLPISFEGKNPKYLIGYISYIDVFKKQHLTRFCLKVDPIAGKFQISGHPAWSNWN